MKNLTVTLEQANEGVVVFDTALEPVYHNKKAVELIGRRVEEILRNGRPGEEIYKYKSDGVTPFSNEELPVQRCLSGESFQDQEMMISYEQSDKEPAWLSITGAPVKNAVDEIVGASLFIRNLTNRSTERFQMKLMSAKLEDQNRKLDNALQLLKDKNSELKSFAASVAHDLKTPLNGIIGFVDIVREELRSRNYEEAQEYLSVIETSANKMNSFIFDILNYYCSYTENDKFDTIDLNHLFEEIQRDIHSHIEQIEAKFEIESLPKVEAVPIRARQLFYNLITNALKYSKPDISPIVRVYQVEGRGEFKKGVVVEDNGIGFDITMKDKLFEPLIRLKTKDSYEGTGLGLALCKKIADQHGWNIDVESQIGAGSKFIVYFNE